MGKYNIAWKFSENDIQGLAVYGQTNIQGAFKEKYLILPNFDRNFLCILYFLDPYNTYNDQIWHQTC